MNHRLSRGAVGRAFRATVAALATAIVFAFSTLHARQMNPSYFAEMRWRSIGPPRSAYYPRRPGVPDPTTYYAGMPEGGVWKTSNGGTTWKPVFDDVHVASIGAVAVAPSDPKIVYVGTGSSPAGRSRSARAVIHRRRQDVVQYRTHRLAVHRRHRRRSAMPTMSPGRRAGAACARRPRRQRNGGTSGSG
jgi:hypothetical protein